MTLWGDRSQFHSAVSRFARAAFAPYSYFFFKAVQGLYLPLSWLFNSADEAQSTVIEGPVCSNRASVLSKHTGQAVFQGSCVACDEIAGCSFAGGNVDAMVIMT